jgi:hypothetical protein
MKLEMSTKEKEHSDSTNLMLERLKIYEDQVRDFSTSANFNEIFFAEQFPF